MKQLLILAMLACLTLFVKAQKITLKGDVNISNFPEVEFTLNIYDPDIKMQNNFELLENNSPVAFSLEHIGNSIDDKSKNVFILFEDMTHSSHFEQRNTFRFILERSLNQFVKRGDKVNIAVFDRNRDGSTPLRFLLNNYSDDTTELIEKVKNYEVKNDHFSNQISSDLYNAIYDGITDLKTKFPRGNNILVVLSGGKNLELSNYNSIETLNQYAKKEKVAVYSMQYMLWEHETIDVLARETFGEFFHIKAKYPIPGDHRKETAADSLVSYMNNAVSRLYGQDYKIEYTSTFEEDGNLHIVTVSVDNDKINVQFKASQCGIVCMFNKQPLLYGGITFTVIVLIIILLLLMKKKRKEKEQQTKKEIDKANKKTEEIEGKLEEQKRVIEQKERDYKFQEEKNRNIQEEKTNEEALLKEMKRAGVLPSLVNINTSEEFKITKPFLTFGRIGGNDYIINDTYISGQHFKIFFIDGFYFIEDLNSSNGTKLNGKLVSQEKLNHNDIVEVGALKFMFRF